MRSRNAHDGLVYVAWFWRDWRASTARAVCTRNPEAGWCYRELLDCLYGTKDCSLPDDDETLGGLCGVDRETWLRAKKMVLQFFMKGSDGRLRSERATFEFRAAIARRDARRFGATKTNALRAAKKAALDAKRSPPSASASASASVPDSVSSPKTPKRRLSPSKGDPAVPPALHPLAQAWNRIAQKEGLPRVATCTGSRRQKADCRLTQAPPEVWEKAYALIAADPFCHGENDRGWKATFDYAIRPEKSGRWLDLAISGETPKPKRRRMSEMTEAEKVQWDKTGIHPDEAKTTRPQEPDLGPAPWDGSGDL